MSVTIVLIQPTKATNVGLIARAMKNFGFSRLILVGDLDLASIKKKTGITARHAFDVIESCVIVPDISSAISNANYVIGTTARRGGDRNLERLTVYPEQLRTFPDLNNCHILFGRESSGLTNQEVAFCDLLVTIPTSEEYNVLNLSHAVAIVLYEISKIIFPKHEWKHRPATPTERKKLIAVFQDLLKKTSFRDEKRNVANLAFENIITRGYITGRETYTVIGVLKWIIKNLEDSQVSSKEKKKNITP
ncbi:MAG: RNA methyltransferase [Candidatus Hodarchaeota archaeon]